MIYVCEACKIAFSEDEADKCICCGTESIRRATDREAVEFVANIFLVKDNETIDEDAENEAENAG